MSIHKCPGQDVQPTVSIDPDIPNVAVDAPLGFPQVSLERFLLRAGGDNCCISATFHQDSVPQHVLRFCPMVSGQLSGYH